MANDGVDSSWNFRDQDALLDAMEAGAVDIVVDLLKHGVASPNEADKNEKGSMPLPFAVSTRSRQKKPRGKRETRATGATIYSSNHTIPAGQWGQHRQTGR